MAEVATTNGSIHIRARLSGDILPGVVSIPHGWSKTNANALTRLDGRDPVTGYTELKTLLCRLSRIRD